MRDITVFSIHPAVKSINTFIEYYHFKGMTNIYNFIWNETEPQFVFCSEHVYYEKRYFKQLKNYYNKNCILIFYAGECIFPDLNIFDYGICWDRIIFASDRLTRIVPCHIMYKNFWVEHKKEISFREAAEILGQKDKFCNFLYSNPNAHPMRDKLFYRISEYKKIDSLGKHLNNVDIPGTGYAGHYSETTIIKMPYKFSIAAENACYEGYTSEKIMTSFQAHTIPIYWGNPGIAEEFNENAFINVHRYSNFEELIEKIKQVNESDELWCKMVSEPWKTKDQMETDNRRMQDYFNFFDNIFSGNIVGMKKAPEGFHPDLYKRFFWNSNINKIEAMNLKRRVVNKIKGVL